MTTPVQPTGANNTGPTTGSLQSGAFGTLGTNVLQTGIDTLNTSVNALTTAVNNLVQNMQTGGMGGVGGGTATRQQGPANNNGGFPSMINPTRMGQQTSGGNGGWGPSVSGMSSGGYVSNRALYSANGGVGAGLIATAGAISGFGVNQAQTLVPLNSYATQSLIGYNYNGMSQNQAMQQLYGQVGGLPGRQLSIGSGNMQDNIAFAQTLQSAAGSNNFMQTARGRGAAQAAYAFGITNPNLTAASAATMGAGLYSPMLSYNMQRLGYGQTILSRSPGGVNLNAGQSAQAILSGLGLRGATSQQVTAAFASGGKAAVSLPYLLQGTGISQQGMQQYLTDYAQLMNNSKLSSTAASNLMQQAATGTSAQMKSARAQLAKYGISTANNDLAALVQNQAAITGRAGDYASGFNSGLQKSAGLLNDFNNMLNRILHGPLGTILGFGGGALGTVAGSALGSGTNMLGTAGAYMMMRRIAGRGGAAAARAAAGEAAGTAAGEAGVTAGTAAAGGSLLAGATATGGAALFISLVAKAVETRLKAGGVSGVLSSNLNADPAFVGRFGPTGATKGGGAAAVGMSTSQQRNPSNPQSASVGSAARKAVSAAESQKGVPYIYGEEKPGVGFDCSALVQWAYKQAGISLPRTSQAQWAALSKRSVPMDKVQEGDLVFSAGSDGSAASPGHVGMMINGHQLIQAPYTGADVQIVPYDQSQWQHAARPSGSGSFISGAAGSVLGSARTSGPGVGNRGASRGGMGAYGSVEEAAVIASMGSYLGGGGGITSNGRSVINGTSGAKNTITGGGAGGGSTKIPGGSGNAVAVARAIARKYGWATGTQWDDFVRVENREASWNLHAQNPTSTAYGVAQFINGPQEYYQWGGNPNNYQGQFTAMFKYIKSRYGSPAGAWANEQKLGYYAAGGTTMPGLSIVGERGPELMMSSGGQRVFSNAQTMQLINAIRGSSPGQSPWKTDITESTTSRSLHQSNPAINVTFGTNSIIVNSNGNSTQTATQSGREIQREIVKHLSHASVHQAIKSGDKL